MRRRSTLTPFDGLLFLMVLIWGGNFSVVKAALAYIPHQPFNAIRLVIASGVYLAAIAYKGWPRLSRRDWTVFLGVAFIGHFVYQICFLGGLSLTTASNSSLILGCSPVAVALASAIAGHEKVSRGQWIGAGLSVVGIYLVVGVGADFGGASLLGDFVTLGAVVCWAVYTVAARSLLERFTPLVVTGLTMALGSAMYVPTAAVGLARLDVAAIPWWVWMTVVFSSVLALNVAYLIWYTSVQRIGNVRTSIYSNLTPLIAVTVAAIFLGERVTATTIGGAAAILAGVFVTRSAAGHQAAAGPPAEE